MSRGPVPSARARFFALFGLIVGVLALGEALARRAGGLMLAVAHRVNFKLALLERRGGANFVVLGSSRGNDCVEPGPIGPDGASVATPSSSLPTLEYVAQKSAPTPGLRRAFIELSRRQMQPGGDDVESTELSVDEGADPLGAFFAAHSKLLRGRRAFAVENWSRLPALVAPSLYDGSEFFHTRWLTEGWVSVAAAGPDELSALVPARAAPTPQSGPEWERVALGYRRVVDAFRAHGVEVVLYGPPLAAKRRAEECDAASLAFRASVAAAAAAPFFDFACAEVPEQWLTDRDEHCGKLGRRRFSAKLAEVTQHAP